MEIATKSQAENGTDNNTIMTPLRVKQSIQANGGGGGASTQSDWNETNPSSDAYIKNKPTNLAVTNQNNNFSTSQTVTASLDIVPSSNFGMYKVDGVPIVQYNANNHRTVVYGAPYDASVTDGAVYIRPDAVHGYGDVVVTPASTSVDKNLIVKGDTYEWGGHYIGDGNDITLSPEGPTDTPPTNDTGDIIFNQWKDEGGGAYREIKKTRIWTDNTYSLPLGPNCEVLNNQGGILYTGHLALEGNNILYGVLSSDVALTQGSYTEIDTLATYYDTTGGRLSINNGKIKIGAGVSFIKVTFNVGLNLSQSDDIYSFLTHNGAQTVGNWVIRRLGSPYDGFYRQDILYVSENDVISFNVYTNTSGSLVAAGSRTNFIVEIIK